MKGHAPFQFAQGNDRMKPTCLQENLNRALGTAGGAPPNRTTMDMLQNFLIDAWEGQLKVAGPTWRPPSPPGRRRMWSSPGPPAAGPADEQVRELAPGWPHRDEGIGARSCYRRPTGPTASGSQPPPRAGGRMPRKQGQRGCPDVTQRYIHELPSRHRPHLRLSPGRGGRDGKERLVAERRHHPLGDSPGTGGRPRRKDHAPLRPGLRREGSSLRQRKTAPQQPARTHHQRRRRTGKHRVGQPR